MKRQGLLPGLAAAALRWVRPPDRGAPYTDYFRALNAELKRHGPMQPSLVIDLDRLDANLDRVASVLRSAGKHFRIVEKSLPSPRLIDYIAQRAGTRRLMSFHRPFLSQDAVAFPDFDVLLGKPLPVGAAAAFYRDLKGRFDPTRQLQWLFDTPQRVAEYAALARALGTRMRANIEIDVGLHRGGTRDAHDLLAMLDAIGTHPELEFSGFMGYDAHVGMGVPKLLGSAPALFVKAMTHYRQAVDCVRRERPALWRDDLTFNAGGSPSYALHAGERLSTEVSVGTALLKPSHYDLATLAAHVPAVFIATPVLKAVGTLMLPGLDGRTRALSWWNPNLHGTWFIYGGWWRADYVAPRGLRANRLFGRSANQEMVNGSPAVGLAVGDQVFLRPQITESVLLEFGDLIILRGGRIIDHWPVFSG